MPGARLPAAPGSAFEKGSFVNASRRLFVCLVAAAAIAATVRPGAQAVPAAPSGLTYQVTGTTVSLNWINSPGQVAFYRVEAGGSPGTTFFTWDSSQLVDPNKLPQLLAQFATTGVPPGQYYVRVRAFDALGAASAPRPPARPR